MDRTSDQKELLLKELTEFKSKKVPNINLFYKENFNGVDRSDGFWNEYDYKFRMEDWKSKLLWCVLKHSFINAFVLVNSFEKMDHKTFRQNFIKILLKQSFEE